MITNVEYFLLIIFLLIAGGWIFKAFISLIDGKPVNINILNPLNLKARWPKEKKEK